MLVAAFSFKGGGEEKRFVWECAAAHCVAHYGALRSLQPRTFDPRLSTLDTV